MHKEIAIGIAIETIGSGIGAGLQMIGLTSQTIGWLIIVLSNAVGFCLIGYSLGKPRTMNGQSVKSTTILAHPKRGLDNYDRAAIIEIIEYLERVHGHTDKYTMESDMLRGVLASNLLNGICSHCGKARNQKGDIVYGL